MKKKNNCRSSSRSRSYCSDNNKNKIKAILPDFGSKAGSEICSLRLAQSAADCSRGVLRWGHGVGPRLNQTTNERTASGAPKIRLQTLVQPPNRRQG